MWDGKVSLKLALVFSIALSLVAPPSADDSGPSGDDLWDDGFGFGKGIEDYFDRVQAIAIMGNEVYVGGRFLIAGDASVNGIAKWDGKSWSNVGGGLDNCRDIFCFPTVYTLQVKCVRRREFYRCRFHERQSHREMGWPRMGRAGQWH